VNLKRDPYSAFKEMDPIGFKDGRRLRWEYLYYMILRKMIFSGFCVNYCLDIIAYYLI